MVQDSATKKSVDPASAEESAEDAALAAIEAEVNDSLVLGPVAISDDLADAADGADAVAEDAPARLRRRSQTLRQTILVDTMR